MKILQHNLVKQLIKFGLVGILGTAEDWTIYLTFTRFISFFASHYLWAKIIGFIVGATSNYIFNRRWTFRSQEQRIWREYSQFVAVSIIGAGFNIGGMYLMVSRWHFYDLYALIIATALAMIWNFIANKFWTFKASSSYVENH